MNSLTKTCFLILLFLTATTSFAAGDYIWEAKFKRELPKAEQGNVQSQYAVGEMYEKGKGAVRDEKKAFDWYMKAAKQGHKKAAYRVGLFFYEGSSGAQDFHQARSWFNKSAEKNYVRAQYYLGKIYENGQGVKQDLDTARKWYEKALAGGYGLAAKGINRIAKKQENMAAARKRINVRAKRPPPKPFIPTKSTRDRLLVGHWKRGKHDVEYMPSALTSCKKKNRNLECNSQERTRNIGMADITYTTKAIIYSFKGNGEFKVSYRNKVTKIKVTDDDFAASGRKVPVSLGWQDAEHRLMCAFDDKKSISCTKDKTREITLTRG
jgi:hypothetical protein